MLGLIYGFNDYSKKQVMIMFSVVGDSGARMARRAINHSVKNGGRMGLNGKRGEGRGAFERDLRGGALTVGQGDMSKTTSL